MSIATIVSSMVARLRTEKGKNVQKLNKLKKGQKKRKPSGVDPATSEEKSPALKTSESNFKSIL